MPSLQPHHPGARLLSKKETRRREGGSRRRVPKFTRPQDQKIVAQEEKFGGPDQTPWRLPPSSSPRRSAPAHLNLNTIPLYTLQREPNLTFILDRAFRSKIGNTQDVGESEF